MKKHAAIMDTLIVLSLVCVFAVCALLVLASGARIYQEISGEMEQQYTQRTALSYIVTKVRHYDAAGAVELGTLDTTPALLLRESDEEGDYVTYLYWYEGSLWELFCYEGEGFLPSDGEKLMALDSLQFTREGDLLEISCVSSGIADRQRVYLRCGEEGAA